MNKSYLALGALTLAVVAILVHHGLDDSGDPVATSPAGAPAADERPESPRDASSPTISSRSSRPSNSPGSPSPSSSLPPALPDEVILPPEPAQVDESSSMAEIMAYRLHAYHREGGELTPSMVAHIPRDLPELRDAIREGKVAPWDIPDDRGLTPVPPPTRIDQSKLPASYYLPNDEEPDGLKPQ